VAATCDELGVDWAEVDVDAPEHPRLREQFGDEVPVTFVDGAQHDFWRVDPQRLRAALSGSG
jgi:glutaredoxin